ncbi:MAG: EAL domain-containing protein [Betaproteobacteria bacterium]|nr:EAL domain-containing protein [Betaproteobacteria bacterium]
MDDPDINQDRLALALEAAELDLWENDLLSGRVTRKATRIFERLGYTEAEAMGHLDDLFAIVHPDDVPLVKAAVADHFSGATANYRCEFRVRSATGAWVWFANYGKIMDRGGATPGRRFIGVTFNIDERKRKEHEISLLNRRLSEQNALLESLATCDPLTSLPNRRRLMDRLGHALKAAARGHAIGALLFIDVDHFKRLNDTLGHTMGDLLLKEVAQRLARCVRETDTVARVGGDEFVAMFENLGTDAADVAARAEAIGQQILAAFERPCRLGAHDYYISSSIGITCFDRGTKDADELTKQADIAMYQAKKAGRNTLRFFDAHMQRAADARVALERELREAIGGRRFELHYQAQVDAAYRPIGAEALIRWPHPTRGMLLPGEFIALAEETGLILPIGQWVIETACAQLKCWRHDALTRDLVLAVNVSAKQFRQAGFAEQVRAALACSGVDPRLLKLELTETMLLEDIEEAVATVVALKGLGVKLSLDDFGTGFSSLQYLKRLPLDEIKIDRMFVRDLAEGANDRAIVRAIVAMAQSLGLQVIAEGVETDIQRALLLQKGCTAQQGFLLGEPMPIAQFTAYLSALRRANDR